jgi:hypothetical protein
MCDLILHIGLPKCMSSTLQQNVFSREEGYFGTAPGLRAENNFAKRLQRIGPFGGRLSTNWKYLKLWADELQCAKDKYCPNVSRIIVSNEFLAASNRREQRPILSMLRKIQSSHWKHGRVRVILVLRSQAHRMGSSYAQVSANNLFPSQQDFLKFVKRSLERYPDAHDYAAWVWDLQKLLGPENLCVLLTEESREQSFWESLRSFAQLDKLDIDSASGGSNSKNTRRKDKKSWTISSYDCDSAAKADANKVLALAWPYHRLSKQRETAQQALKSVLSSRYARKAVQVDPMSRPTEIFLTPEIEAFIQEKCGVSNRRLEALLGRDLTSMGY